MLQHTSRFLSSRKSIQLQILQEQEKIKQSAEIFEQVNQKSYRIFQCKTVTYCLALVSCVVNMLKIVLNWPNLGYISSEFYKLVSFPYFCSSIRHVFGALVKAFNCRFYKNRKNKAECGNI